MMTRRAFGTLLLTAGAGALFDPSPGRTAAVLNDDGLYTQPWFLETFLNLADDLAEATAEGKRLAIMWEQKGCTYCRDTHLINFADPAIEAYVRSNFNILQLNLHGARLVTDFDGEELEERKLARKYGVVFTPTIQFFPETADAVVGKPIQAAEVARVKGYLKPPAFLALFRFVREKAYARQSFPDYLKSQPET